MSLTKEEVKVGTIFEHRMGYIAVVDGDMQDDGTFPSIPVTTNDLCYVTVGGKRWVRPDMMDYIIYQPEEVVTVDEEAEKVEVNLSGATVRMSYEQFEKFVKSFGKY